MTGRSTEFFRGYDTKLVASSESRCGITGLKSNTVSAAIPIPRSYVKSRETMVELARNGGSLSEAFERVLPLRRQRERRERK